MLTIIKWYTMITSTTCTPPKDNGLLKE